METGFNPSYDNKMGLCFKWYKEWFQVLRPNFQGQMCIQAAEQMVSEKTCTEMTCKKNNFLQFTPTCVCFPYSDGSSNPPSISPSCQDISLCSESLPKCFGVPLGSYKMASLFWKRSRILDASSSYISRLLHPNADPTLLCLCF